ncbi:MAG TPA: SDR family NAD(P)-dependent oxidoreductase [Terriglobales bacterium]|jgi:NAD(P)-dependent dehydrogenase (short-subunit alcohol dehydrogenase family)|nr:SDR family NAD(P)-dependent oxidoreductase [Terriglobales bacterium]
MIDSKNLFDLSGKVALVTGASVGFGEAIALAFADYGCDVAVSDLDLAATQRVADAIKQKGRRSAALTTDTSVPEQITKMVADAVRELGTIDIMVNCAGIPQHNAAEDTPVEVWDRVLDINLRGTFLCCQAAARVMLPKGKGVIVNFSSIAGSVGVGRGANAYCASKGGINTLTKQLALEWADRGIRVNAIAPCQFLTPGLKAVMAKPQFDPKKLMETWVSSIPIGRVGQPEEIVGPALFLASEASSMVTGVILPVDGGYLAR